MTKPLMVFHAPYPMEANAASASRARPWLMLQAFKEDYEVHEITGTPAERRHSFSLLKSRVRDGEIPKFIYSESSTQPNVLASSIKAGPDPFIEPRIFFWAKRNEIPVGHYYRDIYWKFPQQASSVHPLRRKITTWLYKFDLKIMQATNVVLFLQSEVMADSLPEYKGKIGLLPPGTTPIDSPMPQDISLFYVGGIGAHYRMHKLFEAVNQVDGVRLTFCVPRSGWESEKDSYEHLLSEKIRVVHASTNELKSYYDDASAALLFVEPSEYRKFVAPMKFYEALSYGKPIITTLGTHVARVCQELGVGVAVPYDAEALARVLEEWVSDPTKLEQYRERAIEVRATQSWHDRATHVATVLGAR